VPDRPAEGLVELRMGTFAQGTDSGETLAAHGMQNKARA
jgi:hypothetical protein